MHWVDAKMLAVTLRVLGALCRIELPECPIFPEFGVALSSLICYSSIIKTSGRNQSHVLFKEKCKNDFTEVEFFQEMNKILWREHAHRHTSCEIPQEMLLLYMIVYIHAMAIHMQDMVKKKMSMKYGMWLHYLIITHCTYSPLWK